MTEEQGIEKLLDLIERAAIAAHGAGAITAQEAVSMRVASGALARGYLAAKADDEAAPKIPEAAAVSGENYTRVENMTGSCDGCAGELIDRKTGILLCRSLRLYGGNGVTCHASIWVRNEEAK